MNEPGALDERLRTLVMQSFEGGGERLQLHDAGIEAELLHFDDMIHPFLNMEYLGTG
ncbi:MAG: hypothetical protein GY702_26815 [Desulfobulbaceae bacterium]|nr:hypothetical protein [Desulfobulbaceae bacterium]